MFSGRGFRPDPGRYPPRPAMLAAAGRPSDANIETRCDDCASPLWIDVTAGRVRAVPPDVVAHFAVPAAQWWADIVFT